MSSLIKTENLTFHYGTQTNIDGISLSVPRGSCFGLLGQNGAGKSTLMKLALGLLKPAEGKVFLFDQELHPKKEAKLFEKIGALVEDPPLYPHLSAHDNLMITVLYRELHPRRIDEVLGDVGLAAQSRQKVGTFSTGMKQRLGIALALLPDPELLILDEPVNGLDPEGIVTIRQLIQQLHQQGKTILLSSHLLHEVELSCDHVGILHRGKMLYQGALIALFQEQYARQPIWIETDQPEKAFQSLLPLSFQPKIEHGKLWVYPETQTQITEIIDLLRSHDINIYQIRRNEVKLEDFYLHFTKAEHTKHEEI